MMKTRAMVILMTPFLQRIWIDVLGCLEVAVDALGVREEGDVRRMRWDRRVRAA